MVQALDPSPIPRMVPRDQNDVTGTFNAEIMEKCVLHPLPAYPPGTPQPCPALPSSGLVVPRGALW